MLALAGGGGLLAARRREQADKDTDHKGNNAFFVF
jgi:hypothetical protein